MLRDAAVCGEIQIAEEDAGPHRLRLAWTGSRGFDAGWRQRVNAPADREIGGGRAAGVSLELRAQPTYRVGEGRRVGPELFSGPDTTADLGSFDEQDHRLGPTLKQKLGTGWSLDAGKLAGIPDAPRPDLSCPDRAVAAD